MWQIRSRCVPQAYVLTFVDVLWGAVSRPGSVLHLLIVGSLADGELKTMFLCSITLNYFVLPAYWAYLMVLTDKLSFAYPFVVLCELSSSLFSPCWAKPMGSNMWHADPDLASCLTDLKFIYIFHRFNFFPSLQWRKETGSLEGDRLQLLSSVSCLFLKF